MVHDLRAVLDAIGYVTRYGIEWRALPVDFPLSHGTVATVQLDDCACVVTAGADGAVHWWKLGTGQQAGSVPVFPEPIDALAADTRGNLVVAAGSNVAVLRIHP
jgi:hypothetical protein